MEIKINNPLKTLNEFTFISAIVMQNKCPELKEINDIITQLEDYLNKQLSQPKEAKE